MYPRIGSFFKLEWNEIQILKNQTYPKPARIKNISPQQRNNQQPRQCSQLKWPETDDTCVGKSHNDDTGSFIRIEESAAEMLEEGGDVESHHDLTSSWSPGTCGM